MSNKETICKLFEDNISNIYEKENFVLTLEDKINIVVQRIYQHYKTAKSCTNTTLIPGCT